MTPPRYPRSRPPYWTLVAFAALMIVPGGWFPVAAGAILAGTLAIGVARARLARGRAASAPSPGSVRIGRDQDGRPVQLDMRQLSAHALILGASGAGKSTTLLRILAERIEHGGAVTAVDLKGSPAFMSTLADAAARAGRPFLLWTPDGPGHWNPLGHGNPTELKDKLISTERFTEPHYQRAAERYLQAVLRVLGEMHPGRAPTLAEVVELTEPRRLAAALRHVGQPLRTGTQDYLSGLTPDQLSAVRGLGTRLAIVTESHTGRYLAPPDAAAGSEAASIDLRRALRGDAVVLFSLNSNSYGKLAAQIGTLVVQDLIAAAGDRLSVGGPQAGQALVGIDEFSALGADHLVSLFARGREAGLSVLVATQELADLDRAAHGLRDQVSGNTAVKIIHRQDVPASAQLVSQMAGTEWVPEETRHFGGGSLRSAVGPRGTRRLVERPVVHPNQIMSLRTGEAIVITKLPQTSVRTVQIDPPFRVSDTSDRPAPDPAPVRRTSPAQRSIPGRRTPRAVRRPPPERGGPEL